MYQRFRFRYRVLYYKDKGNFTTELPLLFNRMYAYYKGYKLKSLKLIFIKFHNTFCAVFTFNNRIIYLNNTPLNVIFINN